MGSGGWGGGGGRARGEVATASHSPNICRSLVVLHEPGVTNSGGGRGGVSSQSSVQHLPIRRVMLHGLTR